MTYYVLVEDGAVATYPYSPEELRLAHPGTSFPDEISADTLAEYGVQIVTLESAPQVQVGERIEPRSPQLVDGAWRQGWDVIELPLEERRAALRVELARIRWEHETGGIEVGGLTVPTDRETQAIVDRMVKAYADGDLTGAISFKRGDGDWVTIDEASARLIKKFGAQHVQACFKRECEIDGLIADAPDQAALDAIDLEEAWPGTSGPIVEGDDV